MTPETREAATASASPMLRHMDAAAADALTEIAQDASRLVDGPHGPQRLAPLQALDRAAQSARIQRRAEREVSLEAQLTLLRHRVDHLELRLAALEPHSDARRE